jgi:hypothetical protein
MKTSAIYVILATLLAVGIMSAPALGDSGQLRDPTRCGSGPANCRKLPPTASDTRRNEPRLPSSESRRKPSERPSLMRTSPLPSEALRRNPNSPGSTGLDKGSTGITPYPRRRSLDQ